MTSLLKKALASAGLELKRLPPPTPPLSSSDPFVVQNEIIEQCECAKSLVFDVGARFGETTANYLENTPEIRIEAFEPFPYSVTKYQERHGDNPRVHLNELALTDEAGVRRFFVNDLPDKITPDTDPNLVGTHSLLPRPDREDQYFLEGADLKESIEVKCSTIDIYCDQNDISEITILKLDIQGGEGAALKGASRLLEQSRIRLIYTEVSFVELYSEGPLFSTICDYLIGFDYHLFNLFCPVRSANGQLCQADAIFLPREMQLGLGLAQR